jgi:hypothetical protein
VSTDATTGRTQSTPNDTAHTNHALIVSHTEESKAAVITDATTGKTQSTPNDTAHTNHALIVSHTEETKAGVATDATTGRTQSTPNDTAHTDHALIVSHTEESKAAVATGATSGKTQSTPNDTAHTDHALIVSHTEINGDKSSAPVSPVKTSSATEDKDPKNSPEYKRIVLLNNQMDVYKDAAAANNDKANAYGVAAENYKRESDKIKRDTAAMSDPESKAAAIAKSKELDRLSAQNSANADTARTLAMHYNARISEAKTSSDSVLNTQDPSNRKALIALVQKEGGPAGGIAASPGTSSESHPAGNPDRDKTSAAVTGAKTDGGSTSHQDPAKSTTAEKQSVEQPLVIRSVKSVPKLIPMDPKLPEDLFFKVQIGAFRHTISGDQFKGVHPLTGETTPQGFIRYTAGMFTKFSAADKAKNDIHALGFKDAFVVAFFHGKRIPMNEALAMLKNPGAGSEPSQKGNPVAVTNPVSGAEEHPVVENRVTAPVSNVLPTANHDAPAAIAKTSQVSEVNGLFYTVQVGVYSNPVSNEKLYGIQPLNTEKLANGTLRYSSGQYTDATKADEARQKIVQLGIKDAFVVAYYNGKRLSVNEAKNFNPANQPADSGNPVPEKAPDRTPSPKQENNIRPSSNVVPGAVAVKPAEGPDLSAYDKREMEMVKSDTGVIFKVQIGAFREEIPIDIANKFLLLSKREVKNFKDENGLTVFTIGAVRKYEDAQFLKEEASAKGIPDAFILAYKDGKKVAVADVKGGK